MMRSAVTWILLALIVVETISLALLWLKLGELTTLIKEQKAVREKLEKDLSALRDRVRELESRALPKGTYDVLNEWCRDKGYAAIDACVSALLNVSSSETRRRHRIEIVEWYDSDCKAVTVNTVVDGDTVIVDSVSVRIVGYNAYELSESKGEEAKRVLKEILKGRRVCLDVDDLEPRDKYGRTLGVLWFMTDRGAWCPLPKLFLLRYREFVKSPLYIPPDEHPYWVWEKRYTVLLPEPCFVTIRNCTGEYTDYTDRVVLTGGVYKVYVDGLFIRTLLLMNGSLTVRLSLPERG